MSGQITELSLERMLVYAHFHHVDIPQYELSEALLTEVARLRLILEKIRKETCVMGSDGGHTGVESLAIDGLKIP